MGAAIDPDGWSNTGNILSVRPAGSARRVLKHKPVDLRARQLQP